MYEYMAKMKNPDNWSVITDIIQPIVEGDILNDDVVRKNVRSLDKLNELGEHGVYSVLVERLKNSPLYEKYLK
ncbi:hypothetical protein MKY82_22085 [Paenibacillus sp. FSL W7-1279]|uniref:hypothetical protein n=1 Tax=Paenibacillus sp. FSL W7-1279 TaxID=2921697 RepID=UPI0030DD27A9